MVGYLNNNDRLDKAKAFNDGYRKALENGTYNGFLKEYGLSNSAEALDYLINLLYGEENETS